MQFYIPLLTGESVQPFFDPDSPRPLFVAYVRVPLRHCSFSFSFFPLFSIFILATPVPGHFCFSYHVVLAQFRARFLPYTKLVRLQRQSVVVVSKGIVSIRIFRYPQCSKVLLQTYCAFVISLTKQYVKYFSHD